MADTPAQNNVAVEADAAAPAAEAAAVADVPAAASAAAAAAAAPTPAPAAPAAAAAPAPDVQEAKRFLQDHKEKLQMNQYWYSVPTISAMVGEAERESKRAAFLSTPSIFFSLTSKSPLQANSKVLDYDEMWADHAGFVKYDFKRPEDIPKELHHTFDFVVIDPPFITAEVWALYAQAARLLLVEGEEDVEVDAELAQQHYSSMQRAYKAAQASAKGQVDGTSFAGNIASMLDRVLGSSDKKSSGSDSSSLREPSAPRPSPSGDPARSVLSVPRGKMLLSTIPEHEGYLYGLLGCCQPRFRPSIPNLIYQYSLYVNYPSAPLMKLNPEIDDEPVQRATSRKKNIVLPQQ